MAQRKLGLVIGNSAYRDSTLSRLATPDVDVGDLADILLDPDIGGFDDVNVLVNASSHIIRRAISNFFAVKDREDLLLFYFSGHGVLDLQGQLFLAVKDTERQLLRATAIPASFITDEMNNSRSQRQLLILDCCHSGAFARGSKGSTGASVGTAAAFEGTGFGRVVLTATDATQYAWEGDQAIGEPANSVFTRYLIQGLKTGEADANRDGRITVDELYDYVYGQVIQETPKQTPGKWAYREQGEIIIAQNPSWKLKTGMPESTSGEQDERKLKTLYTRGLSAYWLEEWEQAESAFSAILELQPAYKDAAEKLEAARKQKAWQDLYEQGQRLSQNKDWPAAVEALQSLLSESPGYKDAASLLRVAEKAQRLKSLYAEARQLYEARQYPAAIKVFENLRAEQPDFQDPEGLLEKAQQAQNAIEKQIRLEETYSRAMQALEAGNLPEAQRLLQQVQALQPDYEETGRLLGRIEAKIRPAEATTPELRAPAEETAAEPSSSRERVVPFPGFEAIQGWLGRVRVSQFEKAKTAPIPAGESTQAPGAEAISTAGMASGTAWRILIVAAGWFIAFLFSSSIFEAIPNQGYWIDRVKALYGYRFGPDLASWLILSAIAGAFSGIILYLVLINPSGKRINLESIQVRHLLSMAVGWLIAFLTAFSIAILLPILLADRLQVSGWLLSGALGGAIGGVITGLVNSRQTPGRHPVILRAALAGALGLGFSFLIAEMWVEPLVGWMGGEIGWVRSREIGNAVAGLMIAWLLLDDRLAKGKLEIRRPAILAGMTGFALASLFTFLLSRQLGENFYVTYIALQGLIGAAVLTIPSKNYRRMIIFGLLGGAGMVVGHFLFTVAGYEHPPLEPAFLGLGIGAVCGLGTRKPSLVILLGLLGFTFFSITLTYFPTFFRDPFFPVLFALAWGINGGALAFLYELYIEPELSRRGMIHKPLAKTV